MLKQSLSNFKSQLGPQQQSHITTDIVDDEYIEEVFEEEADEDLNESIREMTEEERQAEQQILEMEEAAAIAKSNRMRHPVSAVSTGSSKVMTSRPISATYKLTPHVTAQQNNNQYL